MDIPEFVNTSETTQRSESLYRPHPGEVLKRRVIDKIILRHDEIAEKLDISVKFLSLLTQGKVNVTDDLAKKFSSITNISVESWLYYQVQYDLYEYT